MAEEKKKHLLPVGRVINESLFEKDAYNEAATPSYKIEMAFDPDDVTGEETIEDELLYALEDAYGAEVWDLFDNGEIILPLLEGDKLARKREQKGKEGDAYKGKIVIRANTLYNKDGVNGPGGIEVYDESVELMGPANREGIYNGMYGQMAVTIHTYVDERTGNYAAKFFLEAFQKDSDGEKLTAPKNNSGLFDKKKAAGRAKGGSSRRSRKG